MPCYHPLQAWRGAVKESGKRSIVFSESRCKVPGSSLSLPCGQCVGCRLERSRQWAMRCVHESELYDRNCFVTLTFAPEHVPSSISVRDTQLFMKRLRKAYSAERIRFFLCGEYGEKFGRPHYHICLFNFDFEDKVRIEDTRTGFPQWMSDSLSRIWPFGRAVIGSVTFESAAYVARYIMKKVTGEAAAEHYDGRKPEFVVMSRRPGIGKGWYDRFKSDVFPSDEVVVRGVKMRPPKYYDGLYDLDNHVGMDIVKSDRILNAMEHSVMKFDSKGRCISEGERGRLLAKEAVKLSAVKSLHRSLEADHDS